MMPDCEYQNEVGANCKNGSVGWMSAETVVKLAYLVRKLAVFTGDWTPFWIISSESMASLSPVYQRAAWLADRCFAH